MTTIRKTAHPRPEGFTLVEMVLVVAILSVLVTLVVSVGAHVRTKTHEDQTLANMKLLAQAIREYHDARGVYPLHVTDWKDVPNNNNTKKDEAAKNSENLYLQLRAEPRSRKVLENLPQAVFMEIQRNPEPSGPRPKYFADSFGLALNYQYRKENGAPSDLTGPDGSPVLISAGRDMKYDTGDDLRSDGQ